MKIGNIGYGNLDLQYIKHNSSSDNTTHALKWFIVDNPKNLAVHMLLTDPV